MVKNEAPRRDDITTGGHENRPGGRPRASPTPAVAVSAAHRGVMVGCVRVAARSRACSVA
jgi:hypothetical protein